MDPQLPVAFEDYLFFSVYEPLLFLGAGAMTNLGRVILSAVLSMSGYGYFASRPLPLCNNSTEQFETNGEDMSDFRSTVRVPLPPSFSRDTA